MKKHTPVLLQEVINGLEPKKDHNFVDATVGFAGHSAEILKKTGPRGILVGIDQDDEALSEAKEVLSEFGERFAPFHGNFDRILEATEGFAITGGILADLGISSMQVDEAERGFSFSKEAPLDMRMDKSNELTAEQIVNEYDCAEIAKIIHEYSDERFAKRIADRICGARNQKRIETTTELAEIVSGAIPRKFWPRSINPATRTFQALRIAVNDELGALERFLPAAVSKLEKGARIGIITFHGIEDKIVKNYFAKESNPCICPPSFPKCTCGLTPRIKLVTKKPIMASEEEVSVNHRSRSARLRIAEKI